MAHRITVVLAQGQSHHPAKKKLEEEIVSQLLCEPSLEVVVVSHLYDLSADGPGMLCLQGIAGDMIVLSWMYPRAARWTLARNAIQGQEGFRFFHFDEIPDTKAFKNVYRKRLDGLPISMAQGSDIIDEANRVFALNRDVFDELEGSWLRALARLVPVGFSQRQAVSS